MIQRRSVAAPVATAAAGEQRSGAAAAHHSAPCAPQRVTATSGQHTAQRVARCRWPSLRRGGGPTARGWSGRPPSAERRAHTVAPSRRAPSASPGPQRNTARRVAQRQYAFRRARIPGCCQAPSEAALLRSVQHTAAPARLAVRHHDLDTARCDVQRSVNARSGRCCTRRSPPLAGRSGAAVAQRAAPLRASAHPSALPGPKRSTTRRVAQHCRACRRASAPAARCHPPSQAVPPLRTAQRSAAPLRTPARDRDLKPTRHDGQCGTAAHIDAPVHLCRRSFARRSCYVWHSVSTPISARRRAVKT